MAAKDDLQMGAARALEKAVRSGQEALSAPVRAAAAEAAVHFLLAAVLAGGQLLGGCAPFGLALVGASGAGLNAAAALAGAGLGYLVLQGLGVGLRYLSASILTFSLAFAFCDTRLYRRPWAMPAAASVMNALTGLVALVQQSWGAAELFRFLAEVGLTGASVWAFRQVLTAGGTRRALRGERWAAAALFVGAVLTALSQLYLFAHVSVGGILAAGAVLVWAWQGGSGMAAAAGVALGLAMDLAAGDAPRYIMALGAAGLTAGLFRGRRRFSPACAFVLGGVGAVVWSWSAGYDGSILYELFAASVLFLLLPVKLLYALSPAAPAVRAVDEQSRDAVQDRLTATAEAFRDLYEMMRTAFRRPPVNDSDTAVVFDRAADRVCRRCSLRGTCWERDYVTTFNALNDAVSAMLDRGRGTPGDFPAYFSSRCIHFPVFLEAVNEELTALLYRRQYNSRIRDSREAVCRQYEQLSGLLAGAAEDLGREAAPEPARERRLRQHLAAMGVQGEAAVCRDPADRLRVEIRGPVCRRAEQPEELAAMSALMGVPLRREETDREGQLLLVQAEPLVAAAGIAARKKDGETVSGDAGTWFKRRDGKLFVLLCDGMGSGPAAGRESRLAVRLLEQFLRAGVETENALSILSSALGLRGEEEGGFTTIDLLQIDLFTGEAAVFKLGAAPTYVKRGGSVQRLTGSSLPAGAPVGAAAVKADCLRLRLEPGDCVLMVSDGVCGGQDDTWLRRRLERFDGEEPKDLVRALVSEGPEDAADDRTALVLRLQRRSAPGECGMQNAECRMQNVRRQV